MVLSRVLFVDGDEGLLAQCMAATRLHGFDADLVTSAAAAFERIASFPYDVVAADLEQAGIAEPSFMEELCAHYPTTTFVAITRHAILDRPRSHSLDTATATVVVKPFEPDAFISALRDAFDLHQRRILRRAKMIEHATVLLVEDNDGDALLVVEYLSEVCGALVTRTT